MKEIGRQYDHDDDFKRRARLHQSLFRRDNLSVDYNEYGNRLRDDDAKNLLNYYERLNVRKALRKRYPNYSRSRDADMLRSEHIPFNLFAPLNFDFGLAKNVISKALGVDIQEIIRIEFEYAPKPATRYLNDRTAFDTYIEFASPNDDICGIGIEVKYTEKSYKIGKREKDTVENKNSKYWELTTYSGIFDESSINKLIDDDMRQIWRNHLLGISMIKNKSLKEFLSVIVYPSGNSHFAKSVTAYQSLLVDSGKNTMCGLTFEKFFAAIPEHNQEIADWKNYLCKRYIVQEIS
jgi:hypothetical protein